MAAYASLGKVRAARFGCAQFPVQFDFCRLRYLSSVTSVSAPGKYSAVEACCSVSAQPISFMLSVCPLLSLQRLTLLCVQTGTRIGLAV